MKHPGDYRVILYPRHGIQCRIDRDAPLPEGFEEQPHTEGQDGLLKPQYWALSRWYQTPSFEIEENNA